MEKLSNLSKKVGRFYKRLSEKKQYVEFFSGLLSIPVLITVIILNINSLKLTGKSSPTPTPSQLKQQNIYIPVLTNNPALSKTSVVYVSTTPVPTISLSPTSGQCTPVVGPISIASPNEGETVTDNPVNVIINYQTGEYCDVVWSYRINNGSWSDYDDKSLALYNMPLGNIKIDLKVKSIVSGEEKDLTRNFVFSGKLVQVTPTSIPDTSVPNNSSVSAK